MSMINGSHLGRSWDEDIYELFLFYNSAVQATTKESPFYMHFVRQARLPIDLNAQHSPELKDEVVTFKDLTTSLGKKEAIASKRLLDLLNMQNDLKMEKAKPMILEEIYSFHSLFQERQMEKAMRHVPQEVSAIKDRAINNIYDKRISKLDEDSRELLLEMMDYMEKKCISIPIKLAKKA